MQNESGPEPQSVAPEAAAGIAGLEEGPQPVEFRLSPEVVSRLMLLEGQVNAAQVAATQYQAGLCAGLGIPMSRVMQLDVERGVLILSPEPDAG